MHSFTITLYALKKTAVKKYSYGTKNSGTEEVLLGLSLLFFWKTCLLLLLFFCREEVLLCCPGCTQTPGLNQSSCLGLPKHWNYRCDPLCLPVRITFEGSLSFTSFTFWTLCLCLCKVLAYSTYQSN